MASLAGQEAAELFAAMRDDDEIEGDEHYVIIDNERYDLDQVREVTIEGNGEDVALEFIDGSRVWFSGYEASDLLAHFDAYLPEWSAFDSTYWKYRP